MFEKTHKNIQHHKKKSEKQRGAGVRCRGVRCPGLCRGQTRVLDGDEDLVKGRLTARVEGAVWAGGGLRKNCGRKGSFRGVTLMPRTMKAEGPEEGISRKAAFAVAQIANRYHI